MTQDRGEAYWQHVRVLGITSGLSDVSTQLRRLEVRLSKVRAGHEADPHMKAAHRHVLAARELLARAQDVWAEGAGE